MGRFIIEFNLNGKRQRRLFDVVGRTEICPEVRKAADELIRSLREDVEGVSVVKNDMRDLDG